MKLRLVSVFIFIFIITNSFAWNDHAHMTIAAIAWDRLSDQEKVKVTDLLEQHPEYNNSWKGAYNAHKNLLPLGKYLMMRASMWPDEIKKKGNLNFTYNRFEWHYIVQKLYFDRPIDEKNPEVLPDKGNGNVVYAINHVITSIQSPEISKPLKAVYFSWLIHLTADIHQPLHTCAMFDGDKFKKGDRGGNDIYIRTASDTTDLQDFWDELLGTSNDTRTVLQQGFTYRKQIPFKEEYLSNMNPDSWAKESFLIAKYNAYLNGKLKYATNKKAPAPKVPDNYVENSKTLAIKQGTIAGYRLAGQISSIVK